MQLPETSARVLVLGYGNPGRQDDGLGPECARRIAQWQLKQVDTRDDYQLSVEDAYDIAQYSTVIFADASLEQIESFRFNAIGDQDLALFGSHSLSPAAVLELSRTLFNAQPDAYILGIKGFEFDRFEERLSAPAEANLQAALAFVGPWLRSRIDA